ncbi:MAG: penicillin-binding protein 1C [Thiobacillaceae bacterium]|jgi:penicillin-binding protein 1C
MSSDGQGRATLALPVLTMRWAILLCLFSVLAAPMAQAVLPSFAEVRAAHVSSEAWVLDRNGRLLQTVRVDKARRRLPWVSLSDLSPAMTDTLIASEDKRFLRHSGVDWIAMVSAIWTNLAEQQRRGASTLTMQLVGLLDPDLHRSADGRSLKQKWQQIVVARELEKSWTKAQILEAYLNLVNFRGELSGIAAASTGMFGKYPSGLDRSEASLLAALLRSPNARPAVVAKRACAVAQSIGQADCGRISSLAWTALAQRSALEPENQLAPHLARRLDLHADQSMRTSLDADLQSYVLDTLRQQLTELQDRQVEDGAVLVLDNASGEVLAWVGSSDSTSQAPEVDGVTAPRLPGSTLKPFLYGLAIERRLLTAASPLEDSPLVLDTPLGQYIPQNYERDYKGWVSVRTALGSSLNVPAVRTLLLLGVERFHAGLRNMGLSTLTHDSDFYGYSLALGGGEVTLLDLTNAYRSLANGGVWRPVSWLPARGGNPGRNSSGKRVLSRQSAYIISDILADKAARSLTFGLSSPLESIGYASVKTGTSKDMRDNWCLGYSHRYTVGVWVGNASGAPMRDVSGVSGAAPIWQAVINHLQKGHPGQPPKIPRGVESRRVHFEPAIEPDRRELFLAGTGLDRIAMAQNTPLSARIEGPGNGAVLARDPDIPIERQKVRFTIEGAGKTLDWYVNGKPADPAWLDSDGSLLWPPMAGAHRITAQSRDGNVVDAMFVTVK